MARYQQQRYPIGSVSSGTMRSKDLIPSFVSELEYRLKHGPKVSRETRKAHSVLLRSIRSRMESMDNENCDYEDEDLGSSYYDSEAADYDLESLFDALDCYAGPYFYFGTHPGDGADYGYWLPEGFEEDFLRDRDAIKVSDLSEIPSKYRGEVLLVNDHGNMSLYVKTSRTLREIWSVV